MVLSWFKNPLPKYTYICDGFASSPQRITLWTKNNTYIVCNRDRAEENQIPDFRDLWIPENFEFTIFVNREFTSQESSGIHDFRESWIGSARSLVRAIRKCPQKNWKCPQKLKKSAKIHFSSFKGPKIIRSIIKKWANNFNNCPSFINNKTCRTNCCIR